MKAVIYARYSSDSQREESIEVRFGNAPPLQKRTASRFCATTLTVPIPPRRTTDRIFRK